MKPDSRTIAELVQRIVAVANPIRIILFGSAAREEMTPDSDLDVLVVVPEDQHQQDTTGDIYVNLIGFGVPVDVVVATEEELRRYGNNFSLVYYPALREGKEIYAA